MFCSRSFIVSGLTFRSLIHFEFILVYGVIKCSSFILLQMVDQFSQHQLLKRLYFLHCIFLPPVSKIRCPKIRCGFTSGLSVLFHWSIFLSLCQYHTALMTVAMYYSLKSGSWFVQFHSSFSRLLWLFEFFLYFHTNFEIICSSSVKNIVGSLIGIALNL